jgi:hypothetical protein
MKKVNPAGIRNQFINEADQLLAHFDRIAHALGGSQHFKRDVTQLASTTFLSLYVSFERFLSSLFTAYINRDSRKFSSDLSNRVLNSVADRFGKSVESVTKVTLPQHIPYWEIAPFVDPGGFNVEFTSAKLLKDRANQWLSQQYRNRIASLTTEDERLLDPAKAIRDYIVHGSLASYNRMNECLHSVSEGGANPGLGRGTYLVYSVGAYLKAFPGNSSRFSLFAERLKSIAAKL